jgi:hypothetical protein
LYTLHYYPGNASLLPHMVLREIGVPFTLSLVDRTVDAHKSPAYLKLNPHGLIPVMEIAGEPPLHETAAIAMTLADRIVIMRDGRIEQVGTPLDVFHAPASVFVAGFIGTPTMNLLTLPVERREGGTSLVLGDGELAQDPL